jgi:hypothetical protein
MSAEEFIAAVSVIAHMGFNGTQRNELRALHTKVTDDTAHDIAQWVDKQRQAVEKERVSEQGD